MPENPRQSDSGLRQRVITAVLMAVVGLSALFLLPANWFALAAAIVFAGLGGHEAARLAGLQKASLRIGMVTALLAACGLLWVMQTAAWLPWVLGVAVATWLLNLVWLRYPSAAEPPARHGAILKLLDLSIVLVVTWAALSWLQANSPWQVILLLVLIASADTCAYFTGRAVGGPKLAPGISPGKTIFGALGGLAGAMALTALAAALLPASPFHPLLAAVIALVLAPVSIVGDLFISLLKRRAGLKDTSALLPGHGGILDRFDSLSAAAPFFALAVFFWGQ